MNKIINLHFASAERGPGRVVENLARGLKILGWDIYANADIRPDVYQACLQVCEKIDLLDRRHPVGPNLFVLPSDWGDLCRKFDHYVVPCNWVANIYSKYDVMDHATIDVWPVGINVNIWKNPNINVGRKVLIYFKNREEYELKNLIDMLDKEGTSYEVIRYGSYQENDLYQACLRCSHCILLTGTESQGIAYMQILSMGLPCYVINKDKFDYFEELNSNPPSASSVPYFDDRCGVVRSSFNTQDFLEFSDKVRDYAPRSYIEENFTLDKCAQNYIDILKKYE